MKIIVSIFLLFIVSCHQNTENVSANDKSNRSFENKNFIQDNDGNKYVIEDLFKTLVKYKGNKIQWKANVLSNCGSPITGKPEIRSLTLKNDKILVVFGKHSYAEVEIKNGKITCLGSD